MRRILLACVVLSAACSTTAVPPQDPGGIYHSGQGEWGERQLLEVVALPVFWLDPDVEAHPTADTGAEWVGPGFGIRGAIGNRDQSAGILFHGARVENQDSRFEIDCYAMYLDFDVSIPLSEGPTGFLVHAGAGVGAAQMYFDDLSYSDVTTGAFNLRGDLELAPSPKFSLLMGLGGFVWGYPGETEAYGAFIELGGRLEL